MKIMYDKINYMRGNLITVTAEGVGLGELAKIDLKDGRSVFASVLRIDGDQVTLQVFQSTRGISTGDRVTFLNRLMQVTYGDALLGRRLSEVGKPIRWIRFHRIADIRDRSIPIWLPVMKKLF